MSWIVAAVVHGEECALTGPGKRDIKGRDGSKIGESAWVTKRDHATPDRSPKDWWKKYAWIFELENDAKAALNILNEKIAAGQCSDFNKPTRAWVEEL